MEYGYCLNCLKQNWDSEDPVCDQCRREENGETLSKLRTTARAADLDLLDVNPDDVRT